MAPSTSTTKALSSSSPVSASISLSSSWWFVPLCVAVVAVSMSMSIASYNSGRTNSLVDVFKEPNWRTDDHFGSGSGNPSLEGITVVITGANSGLGLYTAAKLYEKGARVIAGVRSKEKFDLAQAEILEIVSGSDAHKAEGGSFEFPAPLDLSEPESIEAFAQATLDILLQENGSRIETSTATNAASIDILINNAGIMGTERAYNSQGIELQMATNHFGHALLTSRLMPALLESSTHAHNPRIVNHASSMHEFTKTIRYDAGAPHYNTSTTTSMNMNPFDIYQDSKLANILYTNALAYAAATSNSNLTVVSCHPGWTHTNLQRRSVIGKLFHLISNVVGMPPSKGAESVLRAALEPNIPPMSYVGPRYKGWGSPLVQKAKPWTYEIQKVAEFVQWSDRYMYKSTPMIPLMLLDPKP